MGSNPKETHWVMKTSKKGLIWKKEEMKKSEKEIKQGNWWVSLIKLR